MVCLGDNEVVDFVEGRMPDHLRVERLAHLDDCHACRALLAAAARAVMPTARDGHSAERQPGAGLAVGDMVGRYRVTRRLGAGAMGIVLAAEHVDLRRQVALKLMLPGSDVADDQIRVRLMREARAASAVRHENVVNVHDVLTLENGSPVIVMDLLEGETLRDRLLRDGSLPLGETLWVVRQVLDALTAAHALGVVHRDLKPDNIFIAKVPGGEMVKIVDFGIAKLTAVDGPAAATAGLTNTGMLIGTPHYMAPEQAFADGDIDARADLWAVGVILYECLAGTRPFEGANVGQVLKRLAHLSFRPLDELVTGVPRALSRLVGQLLSERDVRPTSAAEVLVELETVNHAAEVQLSTASFPGAVTLDEGSWLVRMRRPSTVYASVAAVVCVVGALLLVAFGTGSSIAPSSGTQPMSKRHTTGRVPQPAAQLTAAPSTSSTTAIVVPAASTEPAAPANSARQRPASRTDATRTRPTAVPAEPAPTPSSPPPPAVPGDLLTTPGF